MATISERLREGRTNGTALRWHVTDVHIEAADTIDALVAALERIQRVARIELATTRPDVIEQAEAALALARGEG